MAVFYSPKVINKERIADAMRFWFARPMQGETCGSLIVTAKCDIIFNTLHPVQRSRHDLTESR